MEHILQNQNKVKTYIAFLDILGFKDLVTHNSQSDLHSIMSKLFTNIEQSIALQREKKPEKGQNYQSGIFDFTDSKINCLNISDSIIFWTINEAEDSFRDLVFIMKYFLNGAIEAGIPLRGAITYGDIDLINNSSNSPTFIKQQSLVGKGLLDAYNLEKYQNWSGCFIEESAIEQYEKSATVKFNQLRIWGFVTNYKIPFTNGSKKGWVINWPQGQFIGRSIPKMSEQKLRDAFVKHKKNATDYRVIEKINNTIEFWKQNWKS